MEKLETKIGRLQEHQKKLRAYKHAMNLLNYDSSTAMPSGGADYLSSTLEILSGEEYSLRTAPEVQQLLQDLKEEESHLDLQTSREVEELSREQERLLRVPKEDVMAMEAAVSRATACWQEARKNNDFAAFAPHLEKLIEMKKQYAASVAPEKDVYDALMDDYERGMNRQDMDSFFDTLKDELTPLIAKIVEKGQPDMAFLTGPFDVERQRSLSKLLMEIMGLDRAHCALGESAHPFTTEFSKFDVRITTRYATDSLTSNLYSVVHEGGHAMYELSTGNELIHSILGEGASTAIHESQSRLWENYIGRSESFCGMLLPKLKELFPSQFTGVTTEALYRAVNAAAPSLIRTEADELTYPMHILIRYELEKAIFCDDLKVTDLPEEWNRLYKEYLGVDVPDDASGVLQDIHWAGGDFGYFPSYALGTAYAAQIFETMKKDVNVDRCCEAEDFTPVRRWLTEKIYQHGMIYTPEQLIEKVCGTAFDAEYYTRYLQEKFGRLYEL